MPIDASNNIGKELKSVIFCLFTNRKIKCHLQILLIIYATRTKHFDGKCMWPWIKFIYSEKATNFCEILICPMQQQSNLWWRFCKILWPSHNISTLRNISVSKVTSVSCVMKLNWRPLSLKSLKYFEASEDISHKHHIS